MFSGMFELESLSRAAAFHPHPLVPFMRKKRPCMSQTATASHTDDDLYPNCHLVLSL